MTFMQSKMEFVNLIPVVKGKIGQYYKRMDLAKNAKSTNVKLEKFVLRKVVK